MLDKGFCELFAAVLISVHGTAEKQIIQILISLEI